MYFDFCYRNDIPRVLTVLATLGGDRQKFLKALYDPDPKAPAVLPRMKPT
jgi:hypothetical protein